MISKRYSDDADRYDELFLSNWLENLAESELVKIIERIPQKKLLYEPGCGTGLLTKKLASIPDIESVTAADPYETYLGKARERFAGNSRVRVICADCVTHDLPEPADLIVTRYVYHHIQDMQKVDFLRKLADNLRPGGRIIIMDLFIPPYSSQEERKESLRRFHYYKKKLWGDDKVSVESEDEALELGLKGEQEFKVSLEAFRGHIQKAGLKAVSVKMIEDPRISDPELSGIYIAVLGKPE